MISGHDATRTWDCATPGCDGAANRVGGICTQCFLAGWNPPYELPEEEVPMPEPVVMCRQGCGREAEPRSIGVRGPYGNLCAECREGKRRKAASRTPWNKGARAKPKRARAPAVKPPRVGENGRVAAARRLLTAAEQLELAQTEYDQALAALNGA